MPDTRQHIRIGDYIDIFFYRKWLFIIPFVTVVTISTAVTFFLPAVYRATVMIEVITSPLLTSYDISAGVKQQFDILRERVLSQSALRHVVERLKKDEGGDSSGVQSYIADLRANTKISMIGSQMIKVSYDGRDKKKTSRITRALAKAFIKESFRKRDEEGNSAMDFIGSELEYYRKRIEKKDKPAVQADAMVKHLRDKLRILEGRLAEMLINSKEGHPMVIDLKREIADTREELGLSAGEREPADQTRMEREASMDESFYVELLSKLEMARISQRLKGEEERTKFRIIDLDRILVYKIAPNTEKIAVSGVILGILLGAGLISLAEYIDHSFKGIEDLRAFLPLSALGHIPEIRNRR